MQRKLGRDARMTGGGAQRGEFVGMIYEDTPSISQMGAKTGRTDEELAEPAR